MHNVHYVPIASFCVRFYSICCISNASVYITGEWTADWGFQEVAVVKIKLDLNTSFLGFGVTGIFASFMIVIDFE